MCQKRTNKVGLNPHRVRLEIKMLAIVLCLLLIAFVIFLGHVLIK